MKSIFKNLFVLAVIAGLLYSCSEEEEFTLIDDTITEQQQDISINDIKAGLTLSTDPNSFGQVIQQLVDESNLEIKANDDLTDVVLKLKVENGQLIADDIAFYDSKDTGGRFPFFIDFGAICPKGFSQIASCGNVGDTAGCVGDAVSGHLTSNIAGVGDCSTVQVKVGLFSTSVCAGEC